MPARVRGRECVVGRQDGLAIAAGEVNGARVAGGHVAVAIFGGDGEVAGDTCRRGRRKAGNDEVAGRRGGVAPQKIVTKTVVIAADDGLTVRHEGDMLPVVADHGRIGIVVEDVVVIAGAHQGGRSRHDIPQKNVFAGYRVGSQVGGEALEGDIAAVGSHDGVGRLAIGSPRAGRGDADQRGRVGQQVADEHVPGIVVIPADEVARMGFKSNITTVGANDRIVRGIIAGDRGLLTRGADDARRADHQVADVNVDGAVRIDGTEIVGVAFEGDVAPVVTDYRVLGSHISGARAGAVDADEGGGVGHHVAHEYVLCAVSVP